MSMRDLHESFSDDGLEVSARKDKDRDVRNKRHLKSTASRYIYGGILFTAAVFSAATYYFTSTAEETQLRSDFSSFARETAEIAESRANTLFGQMDSLAIAIAAAAQDQAENNNDNVFGQQQNDATHSEMDTTTAFPNVTIPHLDLRSQRITQLTGADMVLFVPFVETDDKEGFEQYAVQNQAWLTQDYVRYCEMADELVAIGPLLASS